MRCTRRTTNLTSYKEPNSSWLSCRKRDTWVRQEIVENQVDLTLINENKGNTVNYYDHRNSFLNEVIKNRGIGNKEPKNQLFTENMSLSSKITGIPITLSILYKMIADRIGLGQFISFTK